MDYYTFYAYKPESDDYCRGCHMQSYPGDVVFQPELTRDEVIQYWAQCLLVNLQLRINEADYGDIQVLKNGRSLNGLLNDDNLTEHDLFEQQLKDMEQGAKQIATDRLQQIQQEKAAAEEEKKRRAKAASDEAARAMYEALKEQFEPKGT